MSNRLFQSVIHQMREAVDKTIGDEIFCGTINCFGAIDIKATKCPHCTSDIQ